MDLNGMCNYDLLLEGLGICEQLKPANNQAPSHAGSTTIPAFCHGASKVRIRRSKSPNKRVQRK
ncbi:hypothetical protein DEO72_LG11g3514 [Vigna unguiculata]|uniref:Uncharacterized protein n=1 Tax=Vigna unguiculata TaxID=3917 RepID=A0A4D6NX13_VIGUN|nr:hypothetical protein DEO72_LG11g3514 [Vigna unguiculata]